MKLSCADYTWPALSHGVVMAVAADLGLTGIDIGVFGEDTHVKLSAVAADPDGEARRVAGSAERAGLAVADVFLTPSSDLTELAPNHPDPDVRAESLELYRQTLRFAAGLGAPGVTMLPGVRYAGDTAEEAIERAAADLAIRAEMAEAQGLRLSVEGHYGSCVDTPSRFAQLLERTPGLWATLDPSHYAYSGSSAADLVQLVDRTRHVQIRPCGNGLMQGRLTDNAFDYESLIGALQEHGYDGWIATEFVWMEKWSCDRVDNTSETARLAGYLTELGRNAGL